VEHNLNAHGADWCERVAVRSYKISVDSFCQAVMPNLQQQGWQRRDLDWEFKLSGARICSNGWPNGFWRMPPGISSGLATAPPPISTRWNTC
jgi:hypothetical protein